jgi:hypothetical protein
MRPFVVLTLDTNANAGDTITIDGTTYTFVTSLTQGTPYQVLLGNSMQDSTWHLYHAINDSGYLKGVFYSNATVAHATFTGGTSWQTRQMFLMYRTPGATGIGKSVSTNAAARISFDTPTTRMEWNIQIMGATGAWASIGSDQTKKLFFARYVDATHFELYSSANSKFDSSAFGSFTGQTLLISRAFITDFNLSPDNGFYPLRYNVQSWSSKGTVTSDGLFKVALPGCPDTTHELECSMQRLTPEPGQPTTSGNLNNISAFTITGGVGTITFGTAFPYANPSSQNVVVGTPVWLRNITDTAGATTHTLTAVNDSTGTTTGHLVKYIPGTSTVGKIQPFDVGGVIGVCQSGCGTSGTATIADVGLIACVFDNAHTAGHWVSVSGYDDRCHDIGVPFSGALDHGAWTVSITGAQSIGVVQSTGSAGATENVWWNGLNRAYVVRSIDGPADGSNVTRITVNIPGYPDGDYNSTTTLPGVTDWYTRPAFVGVQFTTVAYTLFTAPGQIYPMFPRMIKNFSGFDPATTNRWVFWVKWGKNLVPCGSDSAMEVGTYWQAPGSGQTQGNHQYNDLDPANYSDQWHKYAFTVAPSHTVSAGDTAFDYPNDPQWQGMPFAWKGKSHFFDRMGTFYLDFQVITCKERIASGQDLYISPITMEAATGEPEELIHARVASWSPARFTAADVTAHAVTPSGTQGYDITWTAPKTQIVTYEMRYSTVGSMKTLGFSAGLCQSGTTTCSSTDRVTTNGATSVYRYLSATMAQQPRIWLAFKPISIPIISVSGNGQNPTWIITTSDTSYAAGDKVTVASVGGNTAANVTNTALSAVLPRQTWSRFDPMPFVVVIDSYSSSGGLVQITATNHGLLTGQTAQVYGTNKAALNTQWVVTVVDASNYTLDTSVYATICATACSGGSFRLNLPGTLTSITSDGTATVCTTTTTVAHNLVAGWKISMWGAPDSHLSNTDGITPSTYAVTGAPTSTTFTFACPASTPVSTIFNTDQLGQSFAVQSWPGVALAVAGNGAYTSGGTIFTTEDLKGFAEINMAPFGAMTQVSGAAAIGGSVRR